MENNKDLTTAPVEQTSKAIWYRDCTFENDDCTICPFWETWQGVDYCRLCNHEIVNPWKKKDCFAR